MNFLRSYKFLTAQQTHGVIRATLNDEIPSAGQISICAEGWDCEPVGTVKGSRYTYICISMCWGWRPWNSWDHDAVYVVVAIMYLLYWLYIYTGGETRHNEILIFRLNLTLKVKVNYSQKRICTSDSNLAILAWTGDELWHRQAQVDTHRRTDRQMQAKTIPEDQNWPHLKINNIMNCSCMTNLVLQMHHLYIIW